MPMMSVPDLFQHGAKLYSPDAATIRWAEAAAGLAREVLRNPEARQANLRHGATWFVGVDALPTGEGGVADGVPLAGPFMADLPPLSAWHPAQLSVVFPGYPGRDPGESEAAHRYRRVRGAAHVDGLLAVGADRRRFPLELHSFILGLPLNDCAAAPTIYWPGSHRIIGEALRSEIGDRAPSEVDVTDIYGAARKRVFAEIEPQPLRVAPGGVFLLHRFTLHGTAPWDGPENPEGRMVAFFRPEVAAPVEWLRPDWA